MRELDRWTPYAIYPLVMSAGILLHRVLLVQGTPLLWSTYVPVALGMAAVTWLERRLPHRREWRAEGGDVPTDLIYLIVIQTLLPKALAFLAAASLALWVDGAAELWPSELPLIVQVVIMVFAADFLRYWLHVLSHRHPFFWRFHAVHHSDAELDASSGVRFHTVEIALSFLARLIVLPLLGVTIPQLLVYEALSLPIILFHFAS